MKLRSLLVAVTLFMFVLGIGGQASAASVPPDWMPMYMLDITYASGKLAIMPAPYAAPLGTNTNMMGMPAAGVADFQGTAVSVLHGTSFRRRRFGWNDPGYAMAAMPAMDPTSIVYLIKSIYGAGADISIHRLTVTITGTQYLPGRRSRWPPDG